MKNMATALHLSDLPQRVLIVGLGKTGLSCARYLQDLGVSQLAVTDSREHPPGLDELREQLPDVGLFLGDFDAELFAHTEMLVVSPGVALQTPAIQYAIEQGVPVVGDVELFAREVQGTVAAITGSNGKSTVTTLLGQMAAVVNRDVVAGGNLGKPVLDLLAEEHALYVLELSSFQLETTYSLAPDVAVVLNISADHMDRYIDLDSYAGIKSRIYSQARTGVYNLDDPQVMQMPRTSQALFFTLGEPRGADCFGLRHIDDEAWLCQGDDALLPAKALLMPGSHNLANALAALAMGTALQLPLQDMLDVLRLFPGLEHRTEYVGEHGGVKWYNDSKGTNPGATIAAMQGLHAEDDHRTVLIAGGDCKQADFTALARVIKDTARAVVLIGRDRQQIRQLLDADVNCVDAEDMDEAVAQAARLALPGDRVLLSPACASFDMFDGFEHRGNVFKSCVGRLFA
ncbi:MAG TPA: UDP-N-acetylmuramoyl-L-alanine--D-glutamate ligase [Thiolapillus brandeum]|uniref:UDP-N-acetylmuramoylalanine--D-glutamate ligase n=1 Tax=Thiolapillus brandeum TaxID=1076588 RepID=A0A831K3B3_9GAMM|nr:UDP-N-acetylmuramoyl-L-alanine--D-glutamate ligase [Thiolapillus brandeum]